jgi:hypothetical protein
MKGRVIQPWSPEDDERLRKLAAEGRTSVTIAERMKRTPASVRSRARILEIVLMRHTSPDHVGSQRTNEGAEKGGIGGEPWAEGEGKMMPPPLGLIFTVEVNGKPAVVFEARQLREAAELCNEEWFRADLTTLISNGEPICGIGSKLRARIANEAERVRYQEGSQATEASDDILLVYLVEIDGLG